MPKKITFQQILTNDLINKQPIMAKLWPTIDSRKKRYDKWFQKQSGHQGRNFSQLEQDRVVEIYLELSSKK